MGERSIMKTHSYISLIFLILLHLISSLFHFLKISIEDYGIGIKKIDIKNLFKIDTQYHKIGNNTEEGAGLGLIICKEFIEINKGEIFVESEIKKGSKFTFSLPILN